MKSKKNLTRIKGVLIILSLLSCSLSACSKTDQNVSNENVKSESSVNEIDKDSKKDIKEVEPAKVETTKEETKKEETKKRDNISIKYVGNSCFYITFADGTRLVTDPYGSESAVFFGALPKMEADVITISHTHADHVYGVKDVMGDPRKIVPEDINKTIKVGDVEITGYATKHVDGMGNSTLFVYEEGGLKIVHMGETDNIDSKEAQEAVKDADVILAYAGEYGKNTIKNKDSFETLRKMNIKVIIPQHYSMDTTYFGEPNMDEILTELPSGTKITKTNEFIVKKGLEKQFVVMSRMETN